LNSEKVYDSFCQDTSYNCVCLSPYAGEFSAINLLEPEFCI